MHTWVYKGSRKADTYLYISRKDDFDLVPDGLLKLLGELELVVDFDLHGDRKLAQADPESVRQQLQDAGYFLQLPPTDQETGIPC